MLTRHLGRRLLPALLVIAAFAAVSSPASAAPTKIESGGLASCYLESSSAYCWVGGDSTSYYFPQFGGPVTSKPTLFPGLTSGVTALSLHDYTGCAVVSGAAKCWGQYSDGRMGSLTHFATQVPVPVGGLTSGVTDITTTYEYACAVVFGAVKCWGKTDGYALGTDLFWVDQAETIPTLSGGATAVDGGDEMACAIVSGAVKCWGVGYLGDGTNHTTPTIVSVPGLTANVTELKVDGEMACAIQLGAVKCWGDGNSMIDGDGDSTVSTTPVTPQGLSTGATAISVGPKVSCAVVTDAVKCWGLGDHGQLGNGLESAISPPVAVSGAGPGATAVATNPNVGCAIVSGMVKCWGSNERGMLGDGTLIHALTPISVPSLASGVTDISAGNDSSCAVVSGAGKCWGNLALPTDEEPDWTPPGWSPLSAPTPTTVAGLEGGVTEIETSVGGCAIVSGTAKCWHKGEDGDPPVLQTLSGTESSTSSLDLLGIGGCAVVSDEARCGYLFNSNQPGDVGFLDPVAGLTDGVTDVAEGGNHRCAIQYGSAKCSGMNTSGELGNGNASVGGNTVQQVLGLTSNVTAITTGYDYSCAIVNDAAMCWGEGESGQLGDGALEQSATPVQVEGLTSGVTSISAGSDHACAVKSGDVYCWGVGSDGEMGNNTRFGSSVPVKATDLPNTVTQVSAGESHNCAIAAGGAYCWGANTRGQLGAGTTFALQAATAVADPGDEPSIGFVEPGDHEIIGNTIPIEIASANATSVQCSLGESPWTDCPSSYANVSEGTHRIRAYAENEAGQLAMAVAYVHIDTVAPQATIVSPANGSVVTTSTPSLYFTLDDLDVYVSCTLDGNELVGPNYEGCENLETLPTLSAGAHMLVVTVRDYIGNSTSTTSTFTYLPPTGIPAKATPTTKGGLAGKAKKSGKSLKVGYTFTFPIPKGVDSKAACSGKVKIAARYKKKKKTVKTANLKIRKSKCVAATTFTLPKSTRGKKVTFDAYFAGNSVLLPARDVTKLKIRTK